MIRFFRNFRQNLLTENKFSKYLLYAIGEIILVVIGILIALQINNWNENNKLLRQELTYLQNLREDLKAQIDLLDTYIACENIIIDQSSDVVRHYEINDGFRNMDSIFPKLNDLTVRWTFLNANTTLMEMINQGQINIIQNKDLKADLVDFNQRIEIFAKNTDNNNTNLIDQLTVPNLIERNAYASNGYSERMVELFKSFYLFDYLEVQDVKLSSISTEILSEPKERLELINKVVFRNTMANMQKKGNQSLKALAEEILSEVETEIRRKI
jgi:hypothetical protein